MEALDRLGSRGGAVRRWDRPTTPGHKEMQPGGWKQHLGCCLGFGDTQRIGVSTDAPELGELRALCEC